MLLDTNVIVYAHDPRDRPKQERALLVPDRLVRACRVLDVTPAAVLEGVRFLNPFAPEFDLGLLDRRG